MRLLISGQKARLSLLFGFSLVLFISWWLRNSYIWVQPLDYDEGTSLMFGVLVNAGYPAYSVTFVGIPPLALWAIQAGVALFGPTLTARYPMMLFSLVGIGGIFWLFLPWQNRLNLLAGLLAAVFLSFSPVYFYGSVFILAEVSAVALAILSLAMVWQYYIDRRLIWLALSGLIFALSLALKIFVIFLPVLIGFLIVLSVLKRSDKTFITRRLSLTMGVWLAGFLIPPVIFMLLYNPLDMYQQVFLFRMALRDVWAQRASLQDNFVAVGQMWLQFSPLVAGALLGVVTGWRLRRLEILLWIGWLILATGVLIWHTPLRERYAVMLIPPLAGLSGLGVAVSIGWLYRWLVNREQRRLGLILAALLPFSLISWMLIDPLKSVAQPPSPDTFPDLNLAAVRYVWQYSLANDCIITDDHRFAFAADRLVPPALSEASWARVATGWLTVEDIANQVLSHDCPMLVYADWRFDHHLPDLRARLRQLYLLKIDYGNDVVVYTANKHLHRQPTMPLEARLGQAIRLKGLDLFPPSPWRSGQEVRLATYWMATEQPDRAYKIFVQLRNSNNEVSAGADHFPFPAPSGDYHLTPHLDNLNFVPTDMAVYPAKGMWPTNTWLAGQVIREITPISLPSNLPPGQYRLYIGMYDPDTQNRLPVFTTSDQSDSIMAASIEVVD